MFRSTHIFREHILRFIERVMTICIQIVVVKRDIFQNDYNGNDCVECSVILKSLPCVVIIIKITTQLLKYFIEMEKLLVQRTFGREKSTKIRKLVVGWLKVFICNQIFPTCTGNKRSLTLTVMQSIVSKKLNFADDRSTGDSSEVSLLKLKNRMK